MTDNQMPPCGAAALDYIERGLAVIPVSPGGKVPATVKGINDWSDNPEQAMFWWGMGDYAGTKGSNPRYNVGVVCGQASRGLLVIDVDVHGDVDGRETLREWETVNGKLPETPCQITGGGGLQYFYRATREIRPSANGELGIDVRGDGSYVVMPPSIHPSGEAYEWSVSLDDCDIADADDTVYSLIDYVRPTRKVDENGDWELFELPERIEHDRNNTLFKYGSSLRSRSMSAAEISDLLHLANERRCKPPLQESELMKIVGSVTRYKPGNELASGGSAVTLPAAPFQEGEGEGEKVEKAKPLKGVTSLEICQMMLTSKVCDNIRFNVLDKRPWKMGPVLWDKTEGKRPLEDSDIATLYGYLEHCIGIRSRAAFDTAFLQLETFKERQINPITDVFEHLPKVEMDFTDGWPETCRVQKDDGTWSEEITVCGHLFNIFFEVNADDDLGYSTEVERLMFRQIVGRVLKPGCKADSMVVIVGEQGIAKSTFIEQLALDPSLYLENIEDFDEKHKVYLMGKLIAEVAELQAMSRSKIEAVKQAITAPKDTLRLSYAKYASDYPRTCIFVGTTNRSIFLTDTTGNRRFLPIQCNRRMNDPHPGLFDGTSQILIRQAYAETMAYARHLGTDEFLKTMMLPREILKVAMDMQSQYTEEDSLYNEVADFLDSVRADPNTDRVNVKMVALRALKMDEKEFAMMPQFKKTDIAVAIDKCPGWFRYKGKQRIPNYGTATAWGKS